MRQRVMIAMAMALNPDLLDRRRADHGARRHRAGAGAGGDARLQEEFGTAIVLITHDLGVVAEMADDVVVMYAGEVMEQAPRREIFYRHHNPYTEGLFDSLPAVGAGRRRLTPIRGTPPSLIELPPGCPFAPRCPYAFDRCWAEEPPLARVFGDVHHWSACWLPADLVARTAIRDRLRAETAEPPRPTRPGDGRGGRMGPPRTTSTAAPLLEARAVCKEFPAGGTSLTGRATGVLHAVDGVDLEVLPGRDPRPGRRDRLRQVDPGALPGPAVRRHRGRGLVRRPGHHARSPVARCGRCGARSR